MSLEIQHIETVSGQILVAVYSSPEHFMQIDHAVFKKNYPVRSAGSMRIEIPDLPEGTYGISCFHDVNNNGVLDKNMLGIPTEPYGFSMGARPKFRAPSWEEVKFYFSGQQTPVWLEKW